MCAKFHSEAETERGTLRLALCGPVLSRFGPKTSRLWGGGARNGGGSSVIFVDDSACFVVFCVGGSEVFLKILGRIWDLGWLSK